MSRRPGYLAPGIIGREESSSGFFYIRFSRPFSCLHFSIYKKIYRPWRISVSSYFSLAEFFSDKTYIRWKSVGEGGRGKKKRNAGSLMIFARLFAVETEGMRGAAGEVPWCRLNGVTSKRFWLSLVPTDSSL